MLQPLYANLYAAPHYTDLIGRTLDTAKWRPGDLTLLPHREIFPRVSSPAFRLYADASFGGDTGMIGAIIYRVGIQTSPAERGVDAAL